MYSNRITGGRVTYGDYDRLYVQAVYFVQSYPDIGTGRGRTTDTTRND